MSDHRTATITALHQPRSSVLYSPDTVPCGPLVGCTDELGADLGGNLTAVGASANAVMTGIAKRNGHAVSFWEFAKYGIVVTVVTVGVCFPYLWLRYYA